MIETENHAIKSNEQSSNKLKMTFNLNTIDHLGVKLYNSIPPVIAELISNSYDAEASQVEITIDYSSKEIIVKDDGHGMEFHELNENFLVIGKNRRISEYGGFSKNRKRKVTGKKGLGKLAVFGIADNITITSVSNNKKNTFTMNYNKIKKESRNEMHQVDYEPKIIDNNIDIFDEENGTIIKLTDIKIKNITPINNLAESLSSRFQFFDNDFTVNIKNKNTNEIVKVTNEDFYNRIDIEFEWNFPEDFSDTDNNVNLKWLRDKNVSGKIITKATPFPQSQIGVIIYSRKKLVQERTFFNERSNDLFNTYVNGYFNVDFIDESNFDDLIATDRKSLLWSSNEDTIMLRESLDEVLKIIGRDWRKRRFKKKNDSIQDILPPNFYDGISPVDKGILENTKKQLLNKLPSEADITDIASILKSFKHQFQFESFKEYIVQLNDEEVTVENMEKISSDWELIETHELAKIALGRTETILRFEDFIKNNALETQVIQPFLEKFPWILEPRMTHFDTEVSFKNILKDKFPDDELEGSNRRIDFLCSSVDGTIIIIELKRPNIKISLKEIRQARSYERFIREKRQDITNIKTFLISDRYDMNEETKDFYDSLKSDGKLIIKSYTELIDQAKRYHKQFIDAQDKIEQTKEETTD